MQPLFILIALAGVEYTPGIKNPADAAHQGVFLLAYLPAHVLEKSRAVNKAGMAQLQAGFEQLGLSYVPSRANFILVDIQADPAQTFNALLKQGVIVRPVGIADHLRVSIGTEAENAKFLAALAEVLALEVQA